MENDNHISPADSFIDIEDSAKEVTQFIVAFQHGKIKLILSTKNPHPPKSLSVKFTKKSLKIYTFK